jgi:hypothetical protein
MFMDTRILNLVQGIYLVIGADIMFSTDYCIIIRDGYRLKNLCELDRSY